MGRLLRSELADAWRTWWPTAVAITLAAVLCASASIATTALGGLAEQDSESSRSYAVMLMALTLLVTVAVVSTSVDLAIAGRRRRLALLTLAGLTPGQAGALVYAQSAVIALPATILGGLIAAAGSGITTRYITQGGAQVDPGTRGGNLAGSVGVACLLVVLAVLLAATKGARAARTITALEVLRQHEAPAVRRSRPRRIVVVASTVVLVITILAAALTPIATRVIASRTDDASWSPSTADGAVSAGLFACLALTALLAVTVSTWAPRLLAFASGLVRHAGRPTQQIAATVAREHAGRSTTAITLITVATTMSAGLFSVFLTGADAMRRSAPAGMNAAASGEINTASIITLLAGPFLLALVGAALSATSTMRERLSELTAIQICGTTPRQLLLIPLLEIALYAVISAVVSLGASAALAAIVGAGFAMDSGFVIQIAWAPVLAVPALGALLLAAATVPPAARRLGRPNLAQLATE